MTNEERLAEIGRHGHRTQYLRCGREFAAEITIDERDFNWLVARVHELSARNEALERTVGIALDIYPELERAPLMAAALAALRGKNEQ